MYTETIRDRLSVIERYVRPPRRVLDVGCVDARPERAGAAERVQRKPNLLHKRHKAHNPDLLGVDLDAEMIYERRHTRLIADFGGVSKSMPIFASLFLIICLSSLGLPGTNGFVGEFLILVGTFMVNKTFAILGTAGIIFAAVYLLWMYKRMMFGTITHEENRKLVDLDLREAVALVSIIIFIFSIGIYPSTFTGKTEASVNRLISAGREGPGETGAG